MMKGEGALKAVDQAMETAVAQGVFPAGVLLFAKGHKILYHKGFGINGLENKIPVTRETVFDLASLTKPLATALAVADLIKKGQVALETRLADLLIQTQGTPKAKISLDMLLRHTSGLPSHRRFFESLGATEPDQARQALRQMLLKEPLIAAPGQDECYSDLGYIFLSWAVEAVSGRRLDAYLAASIFGPLGIDTLGFIDLGQEVPKWCASAAPTMDCPWRGRVIQAEVEDENAWAAGGIEGHAGLFGSAGAVHRICCEILAAVKGNGARVLDPGVMASFVQRRPGRTRVAGFDTPSGRPSAAGRYGSLSTIGHLGFTGTSFWLDPESGLITVLLTNRVHPSRENLLIKKFRPLIHDLVFKAFQRFIPL